MNAICVVTGKRQYETEEDAHWGIREQYLMRDDIPQLNVYFCLQCQTYHLTSRVKEERKKRR